MSEIDAILDRVLRSCYPPVVWWSLWTAMWGALGAQMRHQWPREVWGL